ncbi:3-deoxy-manno-octulosonate cytidylyltransferase [Thermosulfidibacter takaii ABI70S6]|uniref:3-deoxy-manno-octulosonate cytidylyltransferase n=1 Tax=Thermosulfidibacter takaii (strain DSM 17441 / JCM 13301 / NBRC 103674 / ABI70S6) TaxID=1298851 RepID=A0A0S3QUL4_THET7|nr:3-deoxy-manno-octulosonate cytidylyltransferase [Thermosulfidibacter takaii]BAT72010.1 3-deoxy-manno-octulosonate cytidylyltransferase [Thermosulfidibacter takaii ABI70S6]
MNVIVIPARYGSTRFPGKPLAKICGKPLIQWVYERASQSTLADDVYVATDDERIVECVEGFGGKAILTPECPTGSDRVAFVAESIGKSWEFIVNVQGDEPLIVPEIIDSVFRGLQEDPSAIVTMKKRIQSDEDYKNPNVVKVVTGLSGYALYFSRSPIPYFRNTGEAYKHIGIYGYSRDILLKFVKLPQGKLEITEGLEQLRALENGIPIKVLETDYEAIGVDVPEDIKKVEKILKGVGYG